jgi:hypothetical protein
MSLPSFPSHATFKRGWLCRAARWSVLLPWGGRKALARDDAAMPALAAGWAGRVHRLGECGWAPAATSRKRYYLAGCRPFALEHSRANQCEHAAVCPWCHMRLYAAAPLAALAGYLKEAGPRPLELVEFRRSFAYAHRKGAVRRAYRRLRRQRRREADALRPLAGVVFCRLDLPKRGVRTVRSGLFVVPAGSVPVGGGYKVWPATRETLAARGPVVFAYPAGLLKGRPADAAVVLRVGRGFRRLSYLGALYGQKGTS